MKQIIIRIPDTEEYLDYWTSHFRYLAEIHGWKLEELDV